MPKDNIERAIAKSTGGDEGQNFQDVIYEVLGPGNISIIIEGISDNKNRTHNELKQILSDGSGKFAEQGSLLWSFERVGIIEIDAGENPDKTPSQLEESIINSGASDFRNIENLWLVETNFTETEKVRQSLEAMEIKIKSTGHAYKAKNPIPLDGPAREPLEKLLDKLEDQDDVQNIYTNAE